MMHDELLDNVAAYALGTLPAADAATVEQHLETCAQCREEYRFLRPAVTAVAYSAEACADAASGAAVAAPLLKARLMKAVRGEAAPRARATVWPPYLVAAACLAVALTTGLIDLSLTARLARDHAVSSAQSETIADFTAPDSQRYPFAGGEVLTHGARLYLAMRGLTAAPPGRVYQAWTLAKGAKAVAPSVTFNAGSGGVAVVRLPESAAAVAAVAVSVEPEGGSKQPTTKPLALVRI